MTMKAAVVVTANAAQAKAELRALGTETKGVITETRNLETVAGATGNELTVLAGKAQALESSLAGVAREQQLVDAKTQRLGVTSGQAAGSMGNLVSQFNDIGMMMMAGQNPLQLAIQQGTQITQVIGPMGAAGAMRALGSAALSLISPMNLVTLGIIAGGAAVVQWFSGGTESVKTLKDAIASLDAQIASSDDLVKVLTGDLSDLAKRYGTVTPEVLALVDAQGRLKLRDMAADAREVKDQLTAMFSDGWNTDMEALAASLQLGTDASTHFSLALDWLRQNSDLSLSDQIGQVAAIRAEFEASVGSVEQMTASQLDFWTSLVDSEAALRRVKERVQEIEYPARSVAQLMQDAGNAAEWLKNAAPKSGWLAGAISDAAALSSRLWSAAQAAYAARDLKISGTGSVPGAPPPVKPGWGAPAVGVIHMPKAPVGGGGGGGGGGAASVKEERDAVAELIKKLEEEDALLRETDPVQKEMLKYRKDLAEASGVERERVEELIRAEIQLKSVREATEFMATSSLDLLRGLTRGGDEARSAIKKLLDSLIDAGLQALWLGKGPLAGILGITGNIFGGLLGGGAAKGTGSLGLPLPFGPSTASTGMKGIAGYRPVAMRAPAAASFGQPTQTGTSGPVSLVQHIHVNGAKGNGEIQEMVANGVKRGIELYDRDGLPMRVKKIMNSPRVVGR